MVQGGLSLLSFFKVSLKLGYVLAMLSFFVTLLVLATSAIFVIFNGSVVADILYLVQMWLPFNLAPIYTWLIVACGLYITYKLYVIGFSVINGVLRD